MELENKENNRYLKVRDERIKTQMTHLESKHKQEFDATVAKLDNLLKENDK